MIRAVIVDDERYARDEIALLCTAHPDVEVVGSCGNAIEALRLINRLKPDLVFLDIQMPRISGIELIGMLDDQSMPRIVFVTAYDEYAVAAFEENAFDYLLKPLESRRFAKTLDRARKADGARQSLKGLDIPEFTHVPCFTGNRIRLVNIAEIEYVCCDLSGVHVVTAEGQAATDMTLSALEEKTDLVHCHRQFLVRLDMVREIKLLDNGLGEILTRSGRTVAVSRRHLRELKERIGLR
jgi:two-component system LytT family response regulator